MSDPRKAFFAKLRKAGWKSMGSGGACYQHPDGGKFYPDNWSLSQNALWKWYDSQGWMPPTDVLIAGNFPTGVELDRAMPDGKGGD